MKVICRKNTSRSPIFTDGKVYEATKDNTISELLYTIRDDRGDVRYIIPGRPSVHLTDGIPEPFGPDTMDFLAGRFEPVQES